MSVVSNPDYRLLTLSDVEQAAQVLSQAFMDDPLCSFMLPRKTTRANTLYKFFLLYAEACIKTDLGYGVGDPLQGIAFWMFPNQNSLSVSVRSIGKFIPLLLTQYPIGYFRARAVLRQIDLLHKKYAAEPHFYLDNIGVIASARGKGLASKLIRPVLEMADAQKAIVYTDTESYSNVALYEHFGFQCVEECLVSGTDITVWALRRPVQ